MDGGLRGSNRLAGHRATVADAYDQDSEHSVFYRRDDPIVAHPVLPEFAETSAFKGFPYAARIFQRGDALIEKRQDTPYDGGSS